MAPEPGSARRPRVDVPGHPPRQAKSQPPGGRLQLLRSCPLFRNLEAAELELILRAAREQSVKRGGFYFRQGDPAQGIYMLLEGRVKLAQAGSVGRRVIVHFVRPTELFGYAVAVARRVYSAAAQALEDSQALAWDAVIMNRLMLEHPAMALNGFHLLAEQVQQTWTCLRDLATAAVEQRTARALLRLAYPGRREGKDWEGPETTLALSQRDLAEHVGTTPYTVNRILRRWEQLGLVDVGRERVRIRQPHQLAAVEKIPAAAAPSRTAHQRSTGGSA